METWYSKSGRKYTLPQTVRAPSPNAAVRRLVVGVALPKHEVDGGNGGRSLRIG